MDTKSSSRKRLYAKLIGGPIAGRSVEIPEGAKFGDIVEVPMSKKKAGEVTIEQKHHYRLDPHPSDKVIAAWVNPADRRQHGR